MRRDSAEVCAARCARAFYRQGWARTVDEAMEYAESRYGSSLTAAAKQRIRASLYRTQGAALEQRLAA